MGLHAWWDAVTAVALSPNTFFAESAERPGTFHQIAGTATVFTAVFTVLWYVATEILGIALAYLWLGVPAALVMEPAIIAAVLVAGVGVPVILFPFLSVVLQPFYHAMGGTGRWRDCYVVLAHTYPLLLPAAIILNLGLMSVISWGAAQLLTGVIGLWVVSVQVRGLSTVYEMDAFKAFLPYGVVLLLLFLFAY